MIYICHTLTWVILIWQGSGREGVGKPVLTCSNNSYFSLSVPISTLILGPSKPELSIYYGGSEGADLCDGVTYLGKLLVHSFI